MRGNPQSSGYSPRPYGTRIPARNGHKHGMHVRLRKEQNRQYPGNPVVPWSGEALERDEQRQDPDLADGAEQETLVELLGEPGDPHQVDDEEDVGGDCEKVYLEGREACAFENEGDVLWRHLGVSCFLFLKSSKGWVGNSPLARSIRARELTELIGMEGSAHVRPSR